MPSDDDPADDWFDGDRTAVDPGQADTEPHRSLDWLGGREAGFSEGVQIALVSLARVFLADGMTEQEASRWCARIEAAAMARG